MKTKSARPKKKITVSKAKEKTWKVFSKYIRLRDCVLTTGTFERGACYTCGRVYPIQSLQAGHFIPGRHNNILFDERGCHAQCYRCNISLSGNPRVYDQKMKEEYGQTVIDELDAKDRELKHFTVEELEEKEDFYKSLVRDYNDLLGDMCLPD